MKPKERAAMQQALEALEELFHSNSTEVAVEKYNMAHTYLREALAEQAEQDPVGVVTKDSLDGVVKWNGWIPREGTKLYAAPVEPVKQEPVGYWDGRFSKGGASALYEVPQESAFGYHYDNYPLYAAPLRTKDLTDEEIWDLWESNKNETAIEFYEAIIAAYKEKNK